MDDATFTRDRLHEAGKRLAERVDALKAIEKERAQRADHERVSAERNRLAEEMSHKAEPIVQIAQLVRQIDLCDREIRRLNNAISTAKFGHIPFVLSGAAPAVAAVFQDVIVRDVFTEVAGLQSPPVVSGGAGAKDKLRVKRSASSPAALPAEVEGGA